MKKFMIALGLGGVLISGLAFASPKAKFDLNGDGTVDAAEKAQLKADFKAKRAERKQQMLLKYDANRNGTLDANERTAMHDDRATAMFQKLDTDGNGSISLAEFKAGKQHGKKFGKRHGRGMGGALKVR